MNGKSQSPALGYLKLISTRFAAIRKDLPKLIVMGEKMAEAILEGGENCLRLRWAPFWPNEFGGRAGGFMGVRTGDEWNRSAKNVAYFALPDARKWDAKKDEKLKRLLDGKAKLL